MTWLAELPDDAPIWPALSDDARLLLGIAEAEAGVREERELSIPIRARSGRIVRASLLPETRERVVFKGSYRVIYRMDEERKVAHVRRFWHTHRNEPDWSGL
ncbi:MAG TPA: hypothetical protein PLA50_01700 [Bacteroidia bacterium]|nr:hypothetical protein [Bacteroidia bacterium]